MRDKNFGLIGELTKRQGSRFHFGEMPIGERFMILNSVDLPGYDNLAVFPNFKPQQTSNGHNTYTGYLNRGSYRIIGSIFENPEML